jgi:outer membrane usher protein
MYSKIQSVGAAAIGLLLTGGALTIVCGKEAAWAEEAQAPTASMPQEPVRATKSDLIIATPPPGAAVVQVGPAKTGVVVPQPAAATANASFSDALSGEFQWSSKDKAGPGGGAAGPVSGAGRINPTDKNIEITAPLRDGSFHLGDLAVRVTPKDELSVSKERLLQMLAPTLRPPILENLKGAPDVEGYLALTTLKEKGFEIKFDPGLIEMQIALSIEQRAVSKLNAGNVGEFSRSENLSPLASFAGYINIRAGADYSSSTFFGADGEANARIGFDGAIRWRDVVFESGAALDQVGGLTRNSSRFIYDLPEQALRFSAGDISPLRTGFQGGSDLLGISVEKSYHKLQPSMSIRPTSNQSFRIERPSSVDVMINGRAVQRLHLRPGDYDLNDLSLGVGANDVSIVIEDDLGQKRTLNFSVFSGASLMAPGVSEWSFSAGVASGAGSSAGSNMTNLYSNLRYDYAAPMVTGVYQRGLTPDLTGSTHLQADANVIMGGVGGAMQTSFGYWVFDGALSDSFKYGSGLAANIGYELTNIRGSDEIKRNIRLTVNYRTERFSPVGVLEPENNVIANMLVSYAQDFPWNISGGISSGYSLGRGDFSDHFTVGVTLGRSFWESISTGLTAGYAQSLGSHGDSNSADGFRAAFRVGYRLDENSSIEVNYGTDDGRSQVSHQHQEGRGVGAWNAQIELDHAPAKEDALEMAGVNGSAGYTANRADLALSHHTGLAGLNTNKIEQRTSATMGTAIAFADGAFAVGRPVTSGFAVVGPHANLPDSDVTVGSGPDGKSAASDILGPALVSDISSYSPSRVQVEVSNLPNGYDLGAGGFDLHAPYKAGYRLVVGSDYTVSAHGSMVNEQGVPISLLTGDAFLEGHPEGRHVQFFTNKAGKFGAQGLCPGRWVVDMDTDPKSRFVIDVPQGAVGLIKLDTLKPVKS